jgi:hypothetical protein
LRSPSWRSCSGATGAEDGRGRDHGAPTPSAQPRATSEFPSDGEVVHRQRALGALCLRVHQPMGERISR